MAPFTPFFTEYLYQNLRKFDPAYATASSAAGPVDVYGLADSVHYLMLPQPEKDSLNPLAVKRFKVLQEAVTLARIAREKRRIRNNLPLREVVVVAAKVEDIEALEYLKNYFLSEVNTWAVKFDPNWENMCSLKVLPNWKDLGKRLGGSMKAVAKAINELSKEAIIDFMKTGKMTVCGFELNAEDIVVKREFAGDAKKYEAVVSDDGSLLVAIDTTAGEDQYSELRARAVVAAVQKLRKSAGLVASDRVEVFYSVSSEAISKQLQQSLSAHRDFIVKRLRQLPVASKFANEFALEVAREVIKDADICEGEITIVFYKPSVFLDAERVAADFKKDAETSRMLRLALTSFDYDDLLARAQAAGGSFPVKLDNVSYDLKLNTHFFASAVDFLQL